MRPGPSLWWTLCATAVLGIAVAFAVLPLAALACAAAVLSGLASIDLLRLRAVPTPQVERELPPVIPVGVRRSVPLTVRGDRALSLEVHDLHPGDWPVGDLPRRLRLHAGHELSFDYSLTPAARGVFEFGPTHLRLHSRLGFWRQLRRAGTTQTVRVYPNFAPLAKLAWVGAEQASRVVGAHLRRRRGEGTEFQQLREYRTGDALRQIDWKASQRARKLISRDYQDERNQQVLLLLDCGRRMLARDAQLSHFDHVLNAALMVAYIALRQGDAVGLLSAATQPRYLAPRRGLGAIDALLNTVFDLQAQSVATDYLDAATQLSLRQPRRALVLLLTNARDEDIDDLLAAVRQLQRRHLVCVASLREQVLDDVAAQPIQRIEDALRLCASTQYLAARARAHQALRAQGTDVLDVTCQTLPSALVEHYLAVKRAGRL